MLDDNFEIKVEIFCRMEDDFMENNKGVGKKYELFYIMYS